MKNQHDIQPAGKVIGICGSLRKGSYTCLALKIALKGAAEYGADVQLIDLREYRLPFYGMVDEEHYPEDVFKLRQEVQQAQGIILGTPEYHGAPSGVLKNALDLLSFREIEGKMVGLVGVAGGNAGAVNALNSLRTIGRNLHAWVLPRQVSIAASHKAFDEQGNIQNQNIESRLLDLGRQVARFATLHESIDRPGMSQNVERIAV